MIGEIVMVDSLKETLEALYDQHARAVWAYARAVTPRRDLAEDLAAEAFLALARRLKAQGAPPDPLGYLLATVRSRAVDELRRRKPVPLDRDPAVPTRDEGGHRERIVAAVRTLDAPLAEAVALHVFAGLTFEESARVAGIPRGTMESRYALALEKLAFLLREERV
jgi:RNA polymerase sigma-70 factor, ECF subfamily